MENTETHTDNFRILAWIQYWADGSIRYLTDRERFEIEMNPTFDSWGDCRLERVDHSMDEETSGLCATRIIRGRPCAA